MKRYAREEGSDLVGSFGELIVSSLARVEVPAGIWRKQRMRTVSPLEARSLIRDFEVDWHGGRDRPQRFLPVVVSANLLEAAATLVAVHDLRTGDAVQLASALAAREADPPCREFACFDRRLAAAAASEGFAVVAGY